MYCEDLYNLLMDKAFYNIQFCAVGSSVNQLQNKETQNVNIVLQCKDRFFKQPNMKGNHA